MIDQSRRLLAESRRLIRNGAHRSPSRTLRRVNFLTRATFKTEATRVQVPKIEQWNSIAIPLRASSGAVKAPPVSRSISIALPRGR